MIRSKLPFALRKANSKTSDNSACKLNVGKLQNENVLQEFQEQLDGWGNGLQNYDNVTLEKRWQRLQILSFNTTAKVLSRAEWKHQDWLNDNDAKLNVCLLNKIRLNQKHYRGEQEVALIGWQKYPASCKNILKKKVLMVRGKSRINATGS